MDANATRFHHVLGREGWQYCLDWQMRPLWRSWDETAPRGIAVTDAGIDWHEERSELILHERLAQFQPPPKDTRPTLALRRGAARDRYGNWYWIDRTRREILVASAGTQKVSHFWSCGDRCKGDGSEPEPGSFRPCGPIAPAAAAEFGGLAVTADHYLVVGSISPAGLLIFDLHAGGPPRQLFWPAAVQFEPFDMAAAPGGGVFVLDRARARYWVLDRYFNVLGPPQASRPGGPVEELFQPHDGSAQRRDAIGSAPRGISEEDAVRLDVSDPVAIEALGGSGVLILDGNPDSPTPPVERFSRIHRYRFAQRVGTFVTTEVILAHVEDVTQPLSLLGYDFAFVPARGDRAPEFLGRLYVVERGGNQSYAFDVREDCDGQLLLKAQTDYLPMRLFGGKGLVAAGDEVFYDFDDRWLPLKAQPRPRYTPEAAIFTPLNDDELDDEELLARRRRNAFDGHEPDCVWHRLFLDACVPPGTEVQVWSRAANEQRALALAPWQPEPPLYLRRSGSELPFVPVTSKAAGSGTWELLFQNARGRYLQLQLRLVGNGRSSPRLHALRAYYPRFSYLNHYLPAVYREDGESASFLDRFLANVEGFFTSIEDRIAAAQVLFDARTAPAEALDWLAGWFGVALDPAWDERKRRLFIEHAMEFFAMRGTVRGVETALRLVLEDCADETLFSPPPPGQVRPSGIRIVEKFRARRTPAVIFGDPTGYEGPSAGLQTTRWLAAPATPKKFAAPPAPGGFQGTGKSCRCGGKLKAKPDTGQGARDVLNADGAAAIADERAGWQKFLAGRYHNIDALNEAYAPGGARPRASFDEVPLPGDFPPQGAQRADWLQWVATSDAAGLSPSRKLWQNFLQRRYGQIILLNKAHEANWPSFTLISLPEELPKRNAPLLDWQQFAGIVLPMHRTAHRFTVLLPMPGAFHEDQLVHQQHRALAERIANLEKPPHTLFEVKFYWAAFRVGAARLGTDTFIDSGSRAPQLIQPAVLGGAYLAETYLAPSHPQSVADRQILGRDELGR
jgi:phage tail-like protein